MNVTELDITQINVAIAEACGWKITYDPDAPKNTCPYQAFDPDGLRVGYACEKRTLEKYYFPNYYESLDAMHAAEKTMTRLARCIYGRELERIVAIYNSNATDESDLLHVWQATAWQRAQAFINTKGLS